MSNGLAELISDIKEQILFMQELGVDSMRAELPQAAEIAKQESGARLQTAVQNVEPETVEQIRCERSTDPRGLRPGRAVGRDRKRKRRGAFSAHLSKSSRLPETL